jgi:hypothetical protein
MTKYGDIAARKADIEKKRQEALAKLEAEERIIEALPDYCVQRIYLIHHSSLYGHKGTLAFKVKTRADVGAFLALMPPVPADLVRHGSQGCYKSNMPADYEPKEQFSRENIVPFWFEVEQHTDMAPTVHVTWFTALDGFPLPLEVSLEIQRDPASFNVRRERGDRGWGEGQGRYTGYANSEVVNEPGGKVRGYGATGGRIRLGADSWPRCVVYWTWDMVGFTTESEVDADPSLWQKMADNMLEVTDDMMALAGRLPQEDMTKCYHHVTSHGEGKTRPCGNPAFLTIVRRDDHAKVRAICKDHGYAYTDHTTGEWLTINRATTGMCCAEVLTGKTCYVSDDVSLHERVLVEGQQQQYVDLCPKHAEETA